MTDERSEQLERTAREEFERAIDAAWAVTCDSTGKPNADAIVLIGVAPAIRALVWSRERWFREHPIE